MNRILYNNAISTDHSLVYRDFMLSYSLSFSSHLFKKRGSRGGVARSPRQTNFEKNLLIFYRIHDFEAISCVYILSFYCYFTDVF